MLLRPLGSRFILMAALALAAVACGSDPGAPVDAASGDLSDAGPSADTDASGDLASADADGAATVDVDGGDDVQVDVDGAEVQVDVAEVEVQPDVSADADADVQVDVDAAADTADVEIGPLATAFGTIEGTCGTLATELGAVEPSAWVNTYAFSGDPFDPDALDAGARTIFDTPNAGGSSKCSEVFSMQLLDDCEGAELYKTETEIVYTAEGSITDYEVLIGADKVGVSVTRAYLGPVVDEYSLADATGLLTKKLDGINESTANVSDDDLWTKQILHVWTLHVDWATTVVAAWAELGPELQADTIVLVTVETGSDFVVTDTCDD